MGGILKKLLPGVEEALFNSGAISRGMPQKGATTQDIWKFINELAFGSQTPRNVMTKGQVQEFRAPHQEQATQLLEAQGGKKLTARQITDLRDKAYQEVDSARQGDLGGEIADYLSGLSSAANNMMSSRNASAWKTHGIDPNLSWADNASRNPGLWDTAKEISAANPQWQQAGKGGRQEAAMSRFDELSNEALQSWKPGTRAVNNLSDIIAQLSRMPGADREARLARDPGMAKKVRGVEDWGTEMPQELTPRTQPQLGGANPLMDAMQETLTAPFRAVKRAVYDPVVEGATAISSKYGLPEMASQTYDNLASALARKSSEWRAGNAEGVSQLDPNWYARSKGGYRDLIADTKNTEIGDLLKHLMKYSMGDYPAQAKGRIGEMISGAAKYGQYLDPSKSSLPTLGGALGGAGYLLNDMLQNLPSVSGLFGGDEDPMAAEMRKRRQMEIQNGIQQGSVNYGPGAGRPGEWIQ